MSYRSSSDVIESEITALNLAVRYGFTPNRSGFICCPFHGEKTPSLKLYDQPNKGWYCFGCGEGGGVISFIQKLFDLSYPQAIVRISTDFSLNLTHEKPNPYQMREFRRKQQEKAEQEELHLEQYNFMLRCYRILNNSIKKYAPKNHNEPLKTEFLTAINNINEVEFWLDNNRLGR